MQALGRRLLPTDRSLDTHVSNLRRKLQRHTRPGQRAERARRRLCADPEFRTAPARRAWD